MLDWLADWLRSDLTVAHIKSIEHEEGRRMHTEQDLQMDMLLAG